MSGLRYDSYQRSSNPSAFEEYTSGSALIAWIDVLGIRDRPHHEVVAVVKGALDLAAQASATGPLLESGPELRQLIGTPNKAMQYGLVGDALVLVEKHQPQTPEAARLALVYRATLLSAQMFERLIIHRGAITLGEVECFVHEGNTIITGAGVIRAYQKECAIKGTGLYYDEALLPMLSGMRRTQIEQHSVIVERGHVRTTLWDAIAPHMRGLLVSQYDGKKKWSTALSRAPGHDYVSRSVELLPFIPD